MRTGRQSITLLTCTLAITALLAMTTSGDVRAQEAQEPPPSPAVEAAEPAPPSAPAAQPGPPATTVPTEPGGEPEPPAVEAPPRAAPSPRPPDRQPETPAPREPAAAEPRDETEIPVLAEVMPKETADPAGAEESGAPPEGSTTTVDEASRATSRRIAHERRTEAIQQSLELLATAPEELPPHQKAAMIGQISQGALVELSALREEMVQARLDLQRLESYRSQIIAGRHQVPRMVRTGQIPALGASARWDELQERSLELQDAIDSAFEERLRLLEDIPRAESDLEQVQKLRDALSATLDPELREVLSDAQEYLQQRLEASQELLALQSRQAAAATEAYDEISHYLEELGSAIITARQRGLLARSPDHVSPETFINLADDLARLPELPTQIVAGYYEFGRPPINMTGWALRLVATIAMLAALVATWLRLPGWLLSVFCADTSHRESAWGEREVQLLVPVARAVLVAAVTSASLLIWGVHGEWTAAAMLVVGTWAMYFGLMTTLRQLLAPRYEQYRIVPVSTETARLIFRLARGLALWSAAILPIIWGLNALEYGHQDVLVLLSVIHVCGLAVIAAAMIYRAGGPQALVAGGETTGTRTWRRALAATAPAILLVAAAVAVLKAAGYVNLGEYLSRILYLEIPLLAAAFIIDAVIRRRTTAEPMRRWLRGGLWLLVVLAQISIFGLRSHHWSAVTDVLRRPLFAVGESHITSMSILRAILVAVIAWAVATLLRGSMNRSRVLRRRYGEGLRYALSNLSFYLIIIAGVLWAMLAGGFPLNALTVLAGMTGIGLGFGLQDIVKNFVAGVILLLERPLAVGDYIEVGGTWGRVDTISLRSTVVRTQSNTHILIPNADIISQQLTNLSHHDRTLRLVIPIGVSYGTDIDVAREVLTEVARQHEGVLQTPEPGVRLAEFADSAILLELLAWVSDPGSRVSTRVGLNLAIWRALKEAGIEIPFPQHDLHLRSTDVPLKIEREPEK